MKKVINRGLSLLMTFSMLFSSASNLTLSTYAEEVDELPAEEVVDAQSTVADDETTEAEKVDEESSQLEGESDTTVENDDEEKEDMEEEKEESRDEEEKEKVDVSSLDGMDFSSKRLLVATDSMDDEAVLIILQN